MSLLVVCSDAEWFALRPPSLVPSTTGVATKNGGFSNCTLPFMR